MDYVANHLDEIVGMLGEDRHRVLLDKTIPFRIDEVLLRQGRNVIRQPPTETEQRDSPPQLLSDAAHSRFGAGEHDRPDFLLDEFYQLRIQNLAPVAGP